MPGKDDMVLNLQAIVTANIIGASLMIMLLISNRTSSRHLFFDEKLFYFMAVMTFLLCTVETLSFVVDGRRFFMDIFVNRLLNSFLFASNAAFAFLWTAYVDYKLFESSERLRRIYTKLSVPAAVMCVLSFLNLKFDIFFTVSDSNVYSRTQAVGLAYAVTYCYMFYSVMLVYLCRKRIRKYLFMPIVLFMVPIFIGSLFQYFFYGVSLTWVSGAVGVVALYINLQNEAAAIDALTGLYSRQYLKKYLAQRSERQRNGVLGGIMLDIDLFKQINDTLGHTVGDRALQDVGRLLRETSGSAAFAARYAGDEFVILLEVSGEIEMLAFMDRIRERTMSFNSEAQRPYSISFSMGYAIYGSGKDTADSFLSRMDKAMYAEKRRKMAVR